MEPPILGLSLYAEDDDDDDSVMNEWQVIVAVIFAMIFVDVRAAFGGSLMHRVLKNAYKEKKRKIQLWRLVIVVRGIVVIVFVVDVTPAVLVLMHVYKEFFVAYLVSQFVLRNIVFL